MPLFEKKKKYEIIREAEDVILRIDYETYGEIPSVEDNEEAMSLVVDAIIDVGDVTKIVFYQKRDYEYDYAQTKLLVEIAQIYKKLLKQKDLFQISNLSSQDASFNTFYSQRYIELQNIVFRKIKEDPVSAYVMLKRIYRRESADNEQNAQAPHDKKYFMLLKYIISLMDKTKLIVIVQPFLSGFKPGNRDLYQRIFWVCC